MTEDEAKSKWCPMVRDAAYSELAIAGINRGRDCDSLCIGSACMMWRTIPKSGAIDGRRKDDPESKIKVFRAMIPGDGYCGLAGKP